MASNFQIYSFKTKNSLHLKLAGNFDGSFAYEFIHTLTRHSKGFYEILIDTNDLNSIHPYGIEMFQKRLNPVIRSTDMLMAPSRQLHKSKSKMY